MHTISHQITTVGHKIQPRWMDRRVFVCVMLVRRNETTARNVGEELKLLYRNRRVQVVERIYCANTDEYFRSCLGDYGGVLLELFVCRGCLWFVG
jgi:hypothetical protein